MNIAHDESSHEVKLIISGSLVTRIRQNRKFYNFADRFSPAGLKKDTSALWENFLSRQPLLKKSRRP
jgi:hypothetical protein